MDTFTINNEEAVLLIIDIQDKLVKPMKYGDQVIENTNILISAAEEFNMPIIYTEQYPRGLGNTVRELEERLKNANRFEKTHFTAYIEEVKEKVNIGILLFLLSVMIGYSLVAWTFLSKATFFFIGGFLLFILSFLLERKKRQTFRKKEKGAQS